MISFCKYCNFSPAESALTQGHPRGEKSHRNKTGRYITPTGYGWAMETKPAEITVVFTVENGSCGAYRFDWLVRQVWGKVTEKRAGLLQATMPAELTVEECVGYSGAVYYVPSEAELTAWVCRAIALGGGK